MRLTIAFGLLISATVLIGCGGGSGSGGTVTSPTPTSLTVADAAPSLGEEIGSVVNAALRAGTATAPPSIAATIAQWLFPVLHAQSGFVANCSRGGNATIRYLGGRPVVLAGTAIDFSNCGMRGRDASFSGTLTSNGYWTTQNPGPIKLNGTVTSTQIVGGTPIAIDAAVLNLTFNGSVGGVTVGTPDTNPPPSPNTCPARLSSTALQVPAGGGAFTVSLTELGASCPWSVTSAPTWITFTTSTGRGQGAIAFTVAATDAARTGSITVNNQNIVINQLAPGAAGGPAAAVGQWSGTVTGNNPCSVGNPTATYNWTATLSLSGNTFTWVWRDTYFGLTRTFTMPAGNTISFTVRDDPDVFNLTGTFASDFQSLNGTLAASIDCLTSVRPTTGSWTGRRTGP